MPSWRRVCAGACTLADIACICTSHGVRVRTARKWTNYSQLRNGREHGFFPRH